MKTLNKKPNPLMLYKVGVDSPSTTIESESNR